MVDRKHINGYNGIFQRELYGYCDQQQWLQQFQNHIRYGQPIACCGY